jgi:hypothetical protein
MEFWLLGGRHDRGTLVLPEYAIAPPFTISTGEQAMKTVLSILFAIMLVGCATPPNPQVTNYRNYIATNKPLAEQGRIQWSSYYTGLYSAAMDARAPSYFLSQINSLIAHARNYETGKISAEQFAHYRREAQTATAAHAEAQAAAQNANNAATISTGLQLMQMSAPRPISPPTTTCRSFPQGSGVVQTTCH